MRTRFAKFLKIQIAILIAGSTFLVGYTVQAAYHRRWVVDYINQNTHMGFACHGMPQGMRTWNTDAKPLPKADVELYFKLIAAEKK